MIAVLFVLEGFIVLKNLDMQSYNIEMWKYSKVLKKKNPSTNIGHEHIPNSSSILQGVEIEINALGMRGPLHLNSDVRKKIFLMGNSITLGWGLPYEDTISAQLMRLEENAIVYNGGVGNYNLVQSVHAYFEKYEMLKPTHIFVQYYPNDAEEIQSESQNVILKTLLENSQLMVSVWTFWSQIKFKIFKGNMRDHYLEVYSESSPGLKQMAKALLKLGYFCKAEEIVCRLFFVPDLFNPLDGELDFIKGIVEQSAIDANLEFIDLTHLFSDSSEQKQYWVTPFDPHPNAHANAKMARAMYSSSLN